jgi:hypothetical protein
MFARQGMEGFSDLTLSPVNPEISEQISQLSCKVRKTVRSAKIGALG